jgi:hypothetical protein
MDALVFLLTTPTMGAPPKVELLLPEPLVFVPLPPNPVVVPPVELEEIVLLEESVPEVPLEPEDESVLEPEDVELPPLLLESVEPELA